MPNGKKKKGHKMATHKRKKRLRKKKNERSVHANPFADSGTPF